MSLIIFWYFLAFLLNPARDPLNFTLVEDLGTPVPLSLMSVDATDRDGDVLTYSIITNNVGHQFYANRAMNVAFVSFFGLEFSLNWYHQW